MQLPGITVARHETFHLRDGWLPKALSALRNDPLALSLPGTRHQLGVGKNMLASIRYWVQATGLAVPSGGRVGGRVPLCWSELATLIIRYDPFLEDAATLWLLHAELASNARLATFWYWAFNHCEKTQFDEDDLVVGFVDYVCSQGHPAPNEQSVRKDIAVFLRTYRPSKTPTPGMLEDSLDCPLTGLGLVQTTRGTKPFAFSIGAKPGPPLALVAYTTFGYRSKSKPGATIISIDELRWAAGGPGRLLLLDTRSLAESLQALEALTEGAWIRTSHTAGLRNVHLGQVAPLEALLSHYEGLT